MARMKKNGKIVDLSKKNVKKRKALTGNTNKGSKKKKELEGKASQSCKKRTNIRPQKKLEKKKISQEQSKAVPKKKKVSEKNEKTTNEKSIPTNTEKTKSIESKKPLKRKMVESKLKDRNEERKTGKYTYTDQEIYDYLLSQRYPKEVQNKNQKRNFRRTCQGYSLDDDNNFLFTFEGQEPRRVLLTEEERLRETKGISFYLLLI